MKTYCTLVGLAGLAVCFYVSHAWHAEPWWVSFTLGFVPGTLVGLALTTWIKERHP